MKKMSIQFRQQIKLRFANIKNIHDGYADLSLLAGNSKRKSVIVQCCQQVLICIMKIGFLEKIGFLIKSSKI